MYYQEKTINGVLHFRNTPEGPWIAYSSEALTIMLNGANARIAALKAFINDVRPGSADDLKSINAFDVVEGEIEDDKRRAQL